jgi:hypothetical protein
MLNSSLIDSLNEAILNEVFDEILCKDICLSGQGDLFQKLIKQYHSVNPKQLVVMMQYAGFFLEAFGLPSIKPMFR